MSYRGFDKDKLLNNFYYLLIQDAHLKKESYQALTAIYEAVFLEVLNRFLICWRINTMKDKLLEIINTNKYKLLSFSIIIFFISGYYGGHKLFFDYLPYSFNSKVISIIPDFADKESIVRSYLISIRYNSKDDKEKANDFYLKNKEYFVNGEIGATACPWWFTKWANKESIDHTFNNTKNFNKSDINSCIGESDLSLYSGYNYYFFQKLSLALYNKDIVIDIEHMNHTISVMARVAKREKELFCDNEQSFSYYLEKFTHNYINKEGYRLIPYNDGDYKGDFVGFLDYYCPNTNHDIAYAVSKDYRDDIYREKQKNDREESNRKDKLRKKYRAGKYVSVKKWKGNFLGFKYGYEAKILSSDVQNEKIRVRITKLRNGLGQIFHDVGACSANRCITSTGYDLNGRSICHARGDSFTIPMYCVE